MNNIKASQYGFNAAIDLLQQRKTIMGGMSSLEFVPSDYKIRYVDSLNPSNITSLDGKNKEIVNKRVKVIIPSKLIEGRLK